MGVTTTPNFGLNKPDAEEDMENWAAQNTSDCDAVDTIATQPTGTYSPNLSAVNVDPTLGNSTLVGHWIRPIPSFIWVWVSLTIGSTFSEGDGRYRFSLPQVANASYPRTEDNAGGIVIGKAVWRNDSSISNSMTGVCQLGPVISTEDTVKIIGEAGLIAFGSDLTFQTGDRIRFGVAYAL